MINFRRSVIIAVLWRLEVTKLPKFALFDAFGEKRHLTQKLSKFCSYMIHRDTDRRLVFKFREIWKLENR